MMGHVKQKWSEWLPLEEHQLHAWCAQCALPSGMTRRFLYTEHDQAQVTRAEVMTLQMCADCQTAYWKEYHQP